MRTDSVRPFSERLARFARWFFSVSPVEVVDSETVPVLAPTGARRQHAGHGAPTGRR